MTDGSPSSETVERQRAALSRPEEAPAALAARALLDLGHKPVVRELHDVEALDDARARWEDRGYVTASGEPVRQDPASRAMVTEAGAEHTVRPLADHPVVERLVALGGPFTRRALLDPGSPLYRWLCRRYGADQAPLEDRPRPADSGAIARQALYVARDLAAARRARELDRMAADDAGPDGTRELGALLGYPTCCTDAFAALSRRWPNRAPILAAAGRTHRFRGRLNNLSLGRFHYISWFPCRYDCGPSLALADAAADALAARNPALVSRVDALLATPRLYVDDATQAVLIGAHGHDGGATLDIAFDRVTPLAALWPGPGSGPTDTWAGLDGADRATGAPDRPAFFRRGRPVTLPDALAEMILLPFGR
jgi:hypothetical protein